jgi:hypothetical protein
MTTVQDVTYRLRAEYLEMPGLRLKAEQAQRLCGIERTMCQTVLDTLVNAKFLYVKPDRQYACLTEGLFSSPAIGEGRPQNRRVRQRRRDHAESDRRLTESAECPGY